MNNLTFEVALSFADSDAWLANDIKIMLRNFGISSYLSIANPDSAAGNLNEKLKRIYINSSLNVMIYSKEYASKNQDSIVYFEKNILANRHKKENEDTSLFILKIDDHKMDCRFSLLTCHLLTKCGVTGATTMIVDRLITQWKNNNNKIFRGDFTPCHPVGIETFRGSSQPCEFQISTNIFNTRRWEELGDLLVDLKKSAFLDKKNGLSVYLIPSGCVPSYLSHSTLLRTRPELLKIKQELIKKFYAEYNGKKLRGLLFYIRKNDIDYPHVYSEELDRFFIKNYNSIQLQNL